VIFPQSMLRLVWFVHKECLADSLLLLSQTAVFHLADHYRLGGRQDLEPLKSELAEYQQHYRQVAAQNLLQTLPENTLLNYKIVDNASLSSLPEGVIKQGEQFAIWIGAKSSGEAEEKHAVQAENPKPALSENQYKTLFETENRVGCVGEWCVIDGWVPASEKRRFNKLLANEVILLTPAEQCGLNSSLVPSLFHRPKVLQGFAVLMGLYDTTGYRELDPTPILALGFTLMFGMMFADLGQGLLLFFLGFWLNNYHFPLVSQDVAKKTGWLLMPIGLSAAIFGLVFGSFFSHEDWIPAIGFHPMENVLLYLLSSVLIGVVLLCIGMGLGLFNAWRGGRLQTVLWEKFGPVGLLFYLALILCVLGQLVELSYLRNTGFAIACGSVILMAQHYFNVMSGENVVLRLFSALLESYDFVMKFIMQTFSFVRIAAFTFAHIALSATVIIFVDMASPHPWLAWFILIVGNLFITVIEGLLVGIQAIRLHFFELFTKFVSGGGVPFTPFKSH